MVIWVNGPWYRGSTRPWSGAEMSLRTMTVQVVGETMS